MAADGAAGAGAPALPQGRGDGAGDIAQLDRHAAVFRHGLQRGQRGQVFFRPVDRAFVAQTDQIILIGRRQSGG